MGRRRSRRRAARQRAHRAPRPKRSLVSRLVLIGLGISMAVGGTALLLAGGTSARLFRVAGILIVVGLIMIVVGVVGA